MTEEIDFIDGSISADWRSVKTRMMLIFHKCFYKLWQDFAAIVPETPRSAQWEQIVVNRNTALDFVHTEAIL